nr:hypothetical protein [Candidatus Freyarchaeota archaeon]
MKPDALYPSAKASRNAFLATLLAFKSLLITPFFDRNNSLLILLPKYLLWCPDAHGQGSCTCWCGSPPASQALFPPPLPCSRSNDREMDKICGSQSQCRVIGEIPQVLAQGLIQESEVQVEMGEILIGKKPGRDTEEITLLGSTGQAVQDIAAANFVYKLTKKKKMGNRVSCFR